MRKTTICYLFILSGLMLTFMQCQNQPALSLNGKTYQVTLTDPSNATNVEQLVFSGDTFEGVDCRKYGFGSASCDLKKVNDGIAFESRTHSPTEGEMIWKGVVKGNSIEGTVVWIKQGQTDITYTFTGSSI